MKIAQDLSSMASNFFLKKCLNSPRIERAPIQKSGVIMIADKIPGFRLPWTIFGQVVSVHDYISQHGTGVTLHGKPRREEKHDNVQAKHVSFLSFFTQRRSARVK